MIRTINYLRPGRRLRIAAATGALVLGLVALLAMTGADRAPAQAGDEARAGWGYPPTHRAVDVDAARAAFERSFALLRSGRPVTLATTAIHDPGLDRSAARTLRVASADALTRSGVTAPDAVAWVAPRSDATQCLLPLQRGASGPAQACATVEQAREGYLLMTLSRSSEDVELFGLVPDGVDRVVVRLADSSSTELPVVENAYAAHLDQPTVSIAFTGPDGQERTIPINSEA
jgi:hypothetical protein